MAAYRRSRRRWKRGGRDTYPARMAILFGGFAVALLGTLLWAAAGEDPTEVQVTARDSDREEQASAGQPAATAPAVAEIPGTTAESIAGAVSSGSEDADMALARDSSPSALPQNTTASAVRPARTAAARVAPPVEDALVADALHGEGVLRLERGEIDEALDRLGRAVERAPGQAIYRNNYGWALYRAGRLEASAEQLERSIRLDPDRAIPHANLAEVLVAQGDTGSALAAYLRFLRLNDDPARERDANRRIAEIRGR